MYLPAAFRQDDLAELHRQIAASRLEGKWKLSQNRPAADRAGVRQGLAASADPRDRELAAHMTKTD